MSGEQSIFSPLTEVVVLVTMAGRAISHMHATTVERAHGNASLDFWIRHDWLDSTLTRKMDSLTTTIPMMSAMADPMLLFAFLMGHATTIQMCQIAESAATEASCRSPSAEHNIRAMRAAREIAVLAKAHEQIGYFKVRQHPLPSRWDWN